MPRIVWGALIALSLIASPAAQAKKFVPPPMPPGYDDPGPEPTDTLKQIAEDLRNALRDPSSVQDFSLCGSRVFPPVPPFSKDETWHRAERVTYFLLNSKNAYGGYTGIEQGHATFVDGKLIDVSILELASLYDSEQQKAASARGVCRRIPDDQIRKLIQAAD